MDIVVHPALVKGRCDIACEERISCEKDTPQGGVISPLLTNIFLHLVFSRCKSTLSEGIFI
jgi:hypothetical protein